MNTKKLIAAVVLALFTLPALASAYQTTGYEYDDVRETLVEGHTVFAVIEATICIRNYGGTNNTTEEVADCPDMNKLSADLSWDVRANVTVQRMGTAVAVLVRERAKPYVEPPVEPKCKANRDITTVLYYENPAVLWFNDQFLVGDDLDLVETEIDANVDVCVKSASIEIDEPWQYPCGGWVYATQAGNPDPRAGYAWSYTESYRIEDPNGYVWIVDKYGLPPTLPLPSSVGGYADVMADTNQTPAGKVKEPVTGFTVTGDDDDASDGNFDYDDENDGAEDMIETDGADDGDFRAVASLPSYYLDYYNLWSVPILGYDVRDPSITDGISCAPYTDIMGSADRTPPADPVLAYNAVLFFFFEDLVVSQPSTSGFTPGSPAPKVHGRTAPDDADVSGCQAGTEWECPTNPVFVDDDMEGNSHRFNDDPSATPGDSGPIHVHPTAAVDLYYYNGADRPVTPDLANRVYAVYDTVGAAAPYHQHPADLVFDDRVKLPHEDACADVDSHQYDVEYVYNGDGTYTGYSNETETEHVRHGEGETVPGDGVNGNDCTGYYDGGSTGWHPSGTTQGPDGTSDGEGYVPADEYY